MKRTPLALLNLLHEKTRLIVAIAGVGFAVLLIFMNLGFQGALLATTVTFYEQLDADIFLTSPESLEISSTKAFPRVRLAQIAGVEGIERTMPLYMEYLLWRNPETRISRAMFVFGINPQDPVFKMPEVQTPAAQQALETPNTVLIDRSPAMNLARKPWAWKPKPVAAASPSADNILLGGGFRRRWHPDHE
jgi:putative ABC transport system permease protein